MRTRSMILVGLMLLLAWPALAQRYRGRPVAHGWGPSPLQLVFEGSAVLPGGDLADDFVGTEKGMGASTGYELGGRLRYYLSPTTAVGPAIHYANFGDWDDVFVDDFGGDVPYAVRCSVWRFGLDIQQFLAPRDAKLRPYVTVGGAVTSNRYQDWVQDDGTFESTSTSLALGLGGGVAMGPMELSVLWTYNPVDSRELPLGDGATDATFDWSYFAVRGGIAFGR